MSRICPKVRGTAGISFVPQPGLSMALAYMLACTGASQNEMSLSISFSLKQLLSFELCISFLCFLLFSLFFRVGFPFFHAC